MGQLSIDCFATEETSKVIYGFSYAYDNSRYGYSDKEVGVLIKFNAAPTPDTLSWSFHSYANVSTSAIPKLSSLSCIVDPNGVFTAFGWQKVSLQDRPGGFRYDPSQTANGLDGWSKIDIPIDYAWTSGPSTIFYLKDALGNYGLYHAFSKTSGSINFGVLNTATHIMENTNTTWTMPLNSLERLKATQASLLVWENRALNPKSYVVALPPGPLTSTPPTFQEVVFESTGSRCAEGYISLERYRHCTITQTYGSSYVLYQYDGNKTLPVVNATAAVSKASSLYSSEYLVAVVGDPSSRFMLIQSGKLMEYGSDTGYMVSTVVVTGPAAGTVKEIPVGFVVKESLGYKNEYHPAPYPSSGWGPNRPPKSTSGSTSSGGSSPNVGIIIAVVVLILIAVAAVFAVVRNRRKKVLNAKPPADGAADPSLYTQGPIYPQPVPQNAVPQPMPHFAQAGAYSPVAGGPMPTTGAAPNPTMPTTSTVFGANPPVFSTHPRPNIVTTVSSDPSATSSASYPVIHPILGQDPSAVPWTPTPFDPHAGTATPSSIPSSAAFGSTTNPSHALSTNSPALPSASPSASAGSHPVSIHGSPVVVATPNSASQTYYSAVIADRPLPTLPQDPPTQIPVAASPPIPTHSRPSNPQARAD